MNPTSSLNTAGVTVSAASLAVFVQWALNGFPHPIPPEVPYLIAAGLVTGAHASYNLVKAWLATRAARAPKA
jgi:hypothetical protein